MLTYLAARLAKANRVGGLADGLAAGASWSLPVKFSRANGAGK